MRSWHLPLLVRYMKILLVFVLFYCFIRSSKDSPLYSDLCSPRTKILHISVSLESSFASQWLVTFRITPSIHLSLCLFLFRFRFHSRPVPWYFLCTRPNHRIIFFNLFIYSFSLYFTLSFCTRKTLQIAVCIPEWTAQCLRPLIIFLCTLTEY